MRISCQQALTPTFFKRMIDYVLVVSTNLTNLLIFVAPAMEFL